LNRSLAGYDYQLKSRLLKIQLSLAIASVVGGKFSTHHTHRIFHDFTDLLRPGDLLVMNNTRVIPARLYGYKPSGALVEVLLLEEQQNNKWLALVKPGRRCSQGRGFFLTDARTQRKKRV